LLLSSITETRYSISDHLLSFRAPLADGRSPLLRTPLSRSDTAARIMSRTFWYAGCPRSDSANAVGRDVAWEMGCDDANQIARILTARSTRTR
jgi:hypothetical protein